MQGRADTRRRRPLLGTWGWLGVLGAQLALVLALLEGGLRLAKSHSATLRALLYLPGAASTYEDIHALEDLMGETTLGFTPHRQWKGFILNSRSFRTREYPVARQPGAYRVVALGDSFTVGAGSYGRTWPALLESEIGQRIGRPTEVFALGVPGVGPRFELRIWELERHLLRPDLVVLAFFVGNDFTDDQAATLGSSRLTPLLRASYTARLARNLSRAWRHRAPGAVPAAAPSTPPGRGGFEVPTDDLERLTFSRDEHLAIEADRLRICLRDHQPELLELATDVVQVLARLDAEVRKAGADLVVMLIPDEYQVNEQLLGETAAMLGVPRSAVDLDAPQRRLTALLEAADIHYLDLLPAFRDAARSDSLYYERNTHWNDTGNALAARLLADYIARELPAATRAAGGR